MRITYQQACSGTDTGITRFPNPRVRKVSDAFDERGFPDHAKLVSALSVDGITIGSKDRDAALCFGLDFALQFHRWMGEIRDEAPDEVTIMPLNERGNSPADRKMRKGRVAFARVHVTSRLEDKAVVFRAEYANPRNAVGDAENFAHDIAIMCVQIAQCLAKSWNKDAPNVRVVIEEHESCPGLIAEADADLKERILRTKWKMCGHYCNGMCVANSSGEPPEFSCECFHNGNCKHN